MRRSPCILALALLAAFASPAAAYFIAPSDSVERRTQAAMSVLQVRVVVDQPEGGLRTFRIDVIERLKGDAPPRDLASHEDTRRLDAGDYVLFLYARRPDHNDSSSWRIPSHEGATPLKEPIN